VNCANAVRTLLALTIAGCLSVALPAHAQTGNGYDLSWHTVDGGGVTFATGGPYSLGATAGQPDAGFQSGGVYMLWGGFWFAAADTFTVSKDFSDDSAASVSVSVVCSSGLVSPASASVSEGTPAVFTVSGYFGAPTCTATETVPAGYTANQTACDTVDLSAGGCTITNTLNTANFTVAKDFSDNNPGSVTVGLVCTSGTVSPLTASASEATPASFTVSGYDGNPSCTATETVPAGYTANEANCVNVPLGTGTCTITNGLNTATFTVQKDFSDNNAAAVTITLNCTSGLVSPPTASASEGSPAAFMVTGFSGAPTCTATESNVPGGYTPNESACASVDLSAGGCTIANTLNGASFIVSKDFSDNNSAAVTVSLACTSGLVSPTSASASEGSPAVFNITGFSGTPNCTATESNVPAGYVPDETGCTSVAMSNGSCTIVNNLTSATFTVDEDFTDNNGESVSVSLVCTSGLVSPTSATASEGSPAVFTVTGFTSGTTCTAHENGPTGYNVDESNCEDVPLQTGQCTITNALIPVATPAVPAVDPRGLAAMLAGIALAALIVLGRRT
jgi:hypothetical protein